MTISKKITPEDIKGVFGDVDKFLIKIAKRNPKFSVLLTKASQKKARKIVKELLLAKDQRFGSSIKKFQIKLDGQPFLLKIFPVLQSVSYEDSLNFQERVGGVFFKKEYVDKVFESFGDILLVGYTYFLDSSIFLPKDEEGEYDLLSRIFKEPELSITRQHGYRFDGLKPGFYLAVLIPLN
jgi:hypothetical protein